MFILSQKDNSLFTKISKNGLSSIKVRHHDKLPLLLLHQKGDKARSLN